MMIFIKLKFAIIFASMVGYINSQAWFERLPDEKLTGVPKVILNNEKNFKMFRNHLLSTFDRTKRPANVKNLEKLVDLSVPFPCFLNNTRSTERPSSVHSLRPGDIDVVAGLGDSLTAANGGFASDVFRLLIENRGISPFVGGEGTWRQYLTLPNVLKEFNPKLIGYSTRDSYSHHPESGFNLAEAGAMSQDLPFMVKQLVKKIKKDPRVDMEKDWKLVTVFIGANNFCSDMCYLRNASTSIEAHRNDLLKAFLYLRDNMPRTMVIFLQTLNIKALTDLRKLPARCHLIHMFECPCLYTLQHISKRKQFQEVLYNWHRVDIEVINDQRFKSKEDFTIVLIPFMNNITLSIVRNPKTGKLEEDEAFLTHDCFHLSPHGDAQVARALWNSMLQEEGKKTTNWIEELDKFRCPSENAPYIYTWKNSNRI